MPEEKKRYIIPFRDIPRERQKAPEAYVEESITSFKEVECEFLKEQAAEESKRCLSCRRCLGCALCWAACEPKAIDFDQEEKTLELTVDSIILAPTVERIPAPVDGNLGYGTFANVVTVFEFERILSQTGPYGGLIMRPYDGEIPQRIAFLHQKAGSGKAGTISPSLVVALKEALSVASNIETAEILILHSTEMEDEKWRALIEKDERITAVKCETQSIQEKEETKDLLVTWAEAGEQKEGEFNLVVVACDVEPSPLLTQMTRDLGLDIKEQPETISWDWETEEAVESSHKGIFFLSPGD
jgi:heterodisulfide reductase subunit A-like polyferredoxin